MATYQDWDIPDIQSALSLAESGNMQQIGRLCDAMLGDGAIVGQLSTRFDGALQLPREIDGPNETYAKSLRDDFDVLCAPAELALIARDGGLSNIMFGELIEDDDGLRLVRRNPEFLSYVHAENQWYVQTAAGGKEPVYPGDGRWLLAFPHGTDYPWRYGIWQALAFAYINRRQAFLNLNAWNNSLAFPIKVLTTSNGANEEEAQETFEEINHFGPFPAIRINSDWKFELVQPSQATPTSLKDAIEAAEREVTLAIKGQSGTTDPGPGFGNIKVFQEVDIDRLVGDMLGLEIAINQQVIPVWAQRKHSYDGWFHHPRVHWDTTPPKDRTAEANTANTSAQAVVAWNAALVASGKEERVDVVAYAKTQGIPLFIPPAAPKPVAVARPEGAPAPAEKPSNDAPEIELAPTDLASIVKVNEARAAKKLPALPDGELTIVEFRAKHAAPIAEVSEAENTGEAPPASAPPPAVEVSP